MRMQSEDSTLTAEELARLSAAMDVEDWRKALTVEGAPKEIHDLVTDHVEGEGKYAVVRDLAGFASYDSLQGWSKACRPEDLRSCLTEDAQSALDLTLSTWELQQKLKST